MKRSKREAMLMQRNANILLDWVTSTRWVSPKGQSWINQERRYAMAKKYKLSYPTIRRIVKQQEELQIIMDSLK